MAVVITFDCIVLNNLFLESLEAVGGTSSSVNESKQEEDEPLATTSQKLDDERILEALEVHEKLQ